MNTSNPFQSAHSDVLHATVDDSNRDKLLAELETRAKAAVQAAHWPAAQALYNKALECCSTSTTNSSNNKPSTLHANLSLVYGKLNQWDQALTSAQTSVHADPTYTKAYWRLAQAASHLHQYAVAVDALTTAIGLEPDNKALQKELEQQQKLQREYVPPSVVQPTTEPAEPLRVTGNQQQSQSSSTNTTTTTATPVHMDTDDVFTASDHVKGYKIVNGKKTSYFHNELSDDAKKLIGDIAPKKLDVTTPKTTDETTTTGTSAWNKAGTWEEKDVSAWAQEQLQALLLSTTYTLPASAPAPHALVAVSAATVQGSASVAAVRGKKRYLYELSVVVDWTFQDAEQSVEARGSLRFPDVDGTVALGEGYEADQWKIDHTDEPNLRPVLEQFVHQQGLRQVLHETIDAWVTLFRETY